MILFTPVAISYEDCIGFINDDELVEVTPDEIRLRKMVLSESKRKGMKNEAKRAAASVA